MNIKYYTLKNMADGTSDASNPCISNFEKTMGELSKNFTEIYHGNDMKMYTFQQVVYCVMVGIGGCAWYKFFNKPFRAYPLNHPLDITELLVHKDIHYNSIIRDVLNVYASGEMTILELLGQIGIDYTRNGDNVTIGDIANDTFTVKISDDNINNITIHDGVILSHHEAVRYIILELLRIDDEIVL